MNRHAPWIVVIVAVLAAMVAIILHTLATAPLGAYVTPTYSAETDWRPPLRNCPKGVKRWECMRHAMWRTDL